MPSPTATQQIIGEAPAFLEMLEHVSRAAPLSKPVLVVGERGTGKELIASRLHYLSDRWEQGVVKVNCAALTESILESELFGHEAGAFTGAAKTHIGHFERADGGTLILDELASISLRMQEKILRAIEYGEVQRVGGNETLQESVAAAGGLLDPGRWRSGVRAQTPPRRQYACSLPSRGYQSRRRRPTACLTCLSSDNTEARRSESFSSTRRMSVAFSRHSESVPPFMSRLNALCNVVSGLCPPIKISLGISTISRALEN